MTKEAQSTIISLAVILAVLLQVLFVFADNRDTPNKAVTDFAKAFYKHDKALYDRLCNEITEDEDITAALDEYIYALEKDASMMGYSTFYLRENLYHVSTHTLAKEGNTAEIALHAIKKPPIRSFFTHESSEVSEDFTVVNEDGKWKVCGDISELVGI